MNIDTDSLAKREDRETDTEKKRVSRYKGPNLCVREKERQRQRKESFSVYLSDTLAFLFLSI